MEATRVKVVSNPYTKTLSFMRWDDGWVPIDYASAPTSGLLSDDLINGFLPFKAKQIVELFIEEYGKDTTIVFEGPSDEYDDLCATCADPLYEDRVELICGDRELANADDVLPEIIGVFGRAEPLIASTVTDREAVDSDISKFVDVSKEQVPLCVIGNYSAGKSTFINALIGYEILPSGTEAVTAKVFKITQGVDPDRATISFGRGDCAQELLLTADGLSTDGSSGDSTFIELLDSFLKEGAFPVGLASQVNHALQFINAYVRDEESCQVSIPDLIEISVPFNRADPWTDGTNFVIFDTPGSNSKTNEAHGRVLKEAMEGLSDGLLIFLAMPKTLDTMDNARLCDAAKSIDAMDDRFTMVIVNSADQLRCPLEGFSESYEQSVLDQTIPRELKPQGIYYVSSPVALGAKTSGSFTDEGTKWVFDGAARRFSDSRDPQYTELYRCNILPQHIKARSNVESEACDNHLLANSGLYCVEREISLFARRYSAYNKCHQAEMLLRRVINTATSVLQDDKSRLEVELLEKEEALRRDKAEITEALGACGRAEEGDAAEGYDAEVLSRLDCDQWFTTIERLRKRESGFTRDSGAECGLDEAESSARETRRAARENIAARIGDVAKTRSMGSLMDAFQGVAEDVGRVRESNSRLGAMQREVDRQAANLLLDYVRDSFTRSFDVMTSDIETRSKRYWSSAAKKTRAALYDTATGSTALSEDKRQEIADIIISFRELSLTTDAKVIFVRSELEESLRLLNIVVFESGRLNLRKVREVYNKRLQLAFNNAVDAVSESHTQSYLAWLDNLMAAINTNITSYNPVLQEHVESIRIKTEEIRDRESKLKELGECLDTVSRLIDWRERG